MYMASPRHAATSPQHRQIPDGPILEFAAIIEESKADEWKKRITALGELVDAIPEGSYYSEGGAAWYNTPPLLRHLANPISDLLKDPRSTVVKRCCEALTELFNKCQTDARYLFKDIMPTVLAVHGQTVQVIRQAVQACIMESIPGVPCKMIMPLWMDRLKIDKSRTVREACALYLGQALTSWTEEGYLTEEIWMQVGCVLIRTLRDPSPGVRSNAKLALEKMRSIHPRHWDVLVNNPGGPAAKDPKVQKWLKRLEQGPVDPEELSVSSKMSFNSDTRFARVPRTLPQRPASQNVTETLGYTVPSSIALATAEDDVPPPPPAAAASAGLRSKAPAKKTGGLGPPLRRPFAQAVDSPGNKVIAEGTPPRHKVPGKSSCLSEDSEDALPVKDIAVPEFPADLHYTRNGPPSMDEPLESSTFDLSEEEDEVDGAEGPFIASIHELETHASKRRSRNSILMKERFRMSSSFNMVSSSSVGDDDAVNDDMYKKRSEEENEVPNAERRVIDLTKVPTRAPEHMVIAIRLLRAHKEHVDTIMETLRVEMDTLRDFDSLLEESGRPTEEETLDYFEAIGLCLDQRAQSGAMMQKELDLISRGEPPRE